jgi:hypothetical protein
MGATNHGVIFPVDINTADHAPSVGRQHKLGRLFQQRIKIHIAIFTARGKETIILIQPDLDTVIADFMPFVGTLTLSNQNIIKIDLIIESALLQTLLITCQIHTNNRLSDIILFSGQNFFT